MKKQLYLFAICLIFCQGACSDPNVQEVDVGIDTGPDLPDSGDHTPPAPVSDFEATSGKFEINLTWKNPTDADFEYVRLYRYLDTEDSRNWTRIYEANGESYTDRAMANGAVFYYKAIAYDTSGNPSAERLTNGSLWARELVDGTGNIFRGSLQIRNKKAYLAYNDTFHQRLKFATNETTLWTFQEIDANMGSDGVSVTLAVDSSGLFHVSYNNRLNNKLKYARIIGTVVNTPVEVGPGGFMNRMVVDSGDDNKIHIVHQDGGLKYSYSVDGLTWTNSMIELNNETIGNVGYDGALTVDSAHQLHIIYKDLQYFLLRYVTGKADAWNPSVAIDSDTGGWGDSALAMDVAGSLHLVYCNTWNVNKPVVKYATNKSGSWSFDTIVRDRGGDPSIAVDSAGDQHVCYQMDGLYYLTNQSGEWVTYLVEKLAGGQRCGIAVDEDKRVYISYSKCVDGGNDCSLWLATSL